MKPCRFILSFLIFSTLSLAKQMPVEKTFIEVTKTYRTRMTVNYSKTIISQVKVKGATQVILNEAVAPEEKQRSQIIVSYPESFEFVVASSNPKQVTLKQKSNHKLAYFKLDKSGKMGALIPLKQEISILANEKIQIINLAENQNSQNPADYGVSFQLKYVP